MYAHSRTKKFNEAWIQSKIPKDPEQAKELLEEQDNILPPLLPEKDDYWDFLNVDFLMEEENLTNGIDFDHSVFPQVPIQNIIAAGSQIIPENNDDDDDRDHDINTSNDSSYCEDSMTTRKRRLGIYHHSIDHQPLEKVQKYTVVGPNSIQMKAIQKILIYLEETIEEEDPELLTKVQDVKQLCEIRHRYGESKYQHLPGAIFEMLVESIGGSTFGRLYLKSKTFQHKRIHDLIDDNSVPKIEKNNYTSHPGSAQTSNQCILSTAVAYGLHLASKLKNEDGISIADDEKSVHQTIQDGASFVSNMNDTNRQEFWEDFLDNNCVSTKNNGTDG